MGGDTSKQSPDSDQGQKQPVNAQEVFKKIDKDNSGSLDKAEVKEAMTAMGKSKEEIQEKMNAFGKRSSLKFDEFKSVLEGKQLPDIPDAAPKAQAKNDAEPKAKAKPKSDAEPKAKAKPKSDAEPKAKKGEGKGGKGKDDKGGKGKGKDGKGKSFVPPTGPYGSGSGFRLNVKNLTDDVNEEKLKEMFAPFGDILGCEVKKQDNGKSRGFGFVVLSSEEEGKKAVLYMNGKDINGKALNVGPAERRENADEDPVGKGKGAGKGIKGKEQMAMAQQQQYMAAAYMQQYQQYYYLQQLAMMQQQQQQAQATQGSYDPSVGREFEGSLKSISAKNGYGFIVCADSFEQWQRDVYIDKELLPPGAKVADRMIFTVEINAKGHPRASSCYPAL